MFLFDTSVSPPTTTAVIVVVSSEDVKSSYVFFICTQRRSNSSTLKSELLVNLFHVLHLQSPKFERRMMLRAAPFCPFSGKVTTPRYNISPRSRCGLISCQFYYSFLFINGWTKFIPKISFLGARYLW